MCLHFPVLFLFFSFLLMLFLHLCLSNFQAQLHCPLLTCFGAYFSISRWLLVIWLPFHPNSNLMSAFQHRIINGCFCACAPVRVYVDKANQPQIQYKYKSTNDVPTHHCWSVNIPTSQTPCSANYMDPDWLTPRDAAWRKSVRVCVCMCMWQFGDSAGFSAQWGEILSKRTVTQSAFCIQHSRSVTCQPGLCITVMDVLINAAQTGAHTLPHRHTLL